MSTILLILQLVLAMALTGLILLQRSEGGALGIGGGGGGFMSGRSATTSIVRMTSLVGVLFILNSVALTIVFNSENAARSILEEPGAADGLTAPGDSRQGEVPSVETILGVDTPDVDTAPEPSTPPGDE